MACDSGCLDDSTVTASQQVPVGFSNVLYACGRALNLHTHAVLYLPSSMLRCADGSTGAPRGAGLVVLTNMQWFYGPTWGRTVRFCSPSMQGRLSNGGQCAVPAEVQARQLELVEVLRRNVLHKAVHEVHVLVGEAKPVHRFLARLPWYQRLGCKVHLIETRSRPSFDDYMRHISGSLLGRAVIFTNQDIFLSEDSAWQSLAHTLGPRAAFFLSRYHTRERYNVQHSIAAGVAENISNWGNWGSGPSDRGIFPAIARAAGASGASRAAIEPHVCDMTARRFGVWRRSLCSSANFGSYDAYVIRLERSLTSNELDLFKYPQNAWGGENLFLFLIQQALGMTTTNPCLSLRVMHMHCELPTAFGVHKVGDRRLGKREIIERALVKLRKLGHPAASMSHVDIGKLALNVTGLSR